MINNPIQIVITGKLSYSDDITISQAAQIIAFLNAEGAESTALTAKSSPSVSAEPITMPQKVASPREALELSGAQRNPEKIVALGAYVLLDGGETFKSEDVKTQFRRARETAPGNFTRDLGIAISSGWVIEDGDGEYLLHNKFDTIFDGGFTFPKAVGSGRARATTKSVKPESLSDIDAFHTSLDGYPAYSKMKSEKDRLLWVLAYMNENHNRIGASNQEIIYITDQIGMGISSGNLTGAFNTAKKPGFAFRSQSDRSIRITDAGKAYLAAVGTKSEV